MTIAALQEAVLSATTDSADAESVYNDAVQKAATANANLVAAGNSLRPILADIADKATMKATGLENIIQQISRDQYASFIRLLMGVVPQSR